MARILDIKGVKGAISLLLIISDGIPLLSILGGKLYLSR